MMVNIADYIGYYNYNFINYSHDYDCIGYHEDHIKNIGDYIGDYIGHYKDDYKIMIYDQHKAI